MRSILLALALVAIAACGSKSELAVCGNGVVEPGEPCDGTVPFTCYEGTLACDVDCELDDSACTSYCGDDTINGPGGAEACDGTDLPVACNDGGTIACRTDCTLDRSGCGGGSCGDGTRNGEEECDGVDVDTICHEGTLTCDADCALITTACASYCGDEEVTGAEACDTTPAACHGSGATVCNRDCTIDPAGCTGGYCGDGVRNGPEACDGGDLPFACHPGLGTLTCAADCTLDDSACSGYCGDGTRNGPELGELGCDGDDHPCTCDVPATCSTACVLSCAGTCD